LRHTVSRVISDLEKAYFAGFFDGEGTISISRVQRGSGKLAYQLAIAVGLTHLPTLQKVRDIWTLGSIKDTRLNQNVAHTNKKQYWVWQVKANEACYILKTVLPYLSVKKAEAEIAVAFQEEKKRSNQFWGRGPSKPQSYFKNEERFAQLIKQSRQANSSVIKQAEEILKTDQLAFFDTKEEKL
jgi:hypothetical protein